MHVGSRAESVLIGQRVIVVICVVEESTGPVELVIEIYYNAVMLPARSPWAVVVSAWEEGALGSGAIGVASKLFHNLGVNDPNRVVALLL